MANFTYVWNPDVKDLYKGKDPEKVANEIFSICDAPTKEQIVEKAKDESTELHGMFEWNDTVAAQKYRVVQAGEIYRNLKVIIADTGLNGDTDEEMKPITVRVFHRIPGNQGYQPITRIMSDETKYKLLLEEAYEALRALKNKYQMLQELKPIFDMI